MSLAAETSTFLHAPSEQYETSFLEAAVEFQAEGRLDSTYAGLLGYDLPRLQRQFRTFVRDLQRLSDKSRLRTSGYRDRVLWLVDSLEFLGQTSIRLELSSPYLITYGGHIGYSIRPGRRHSGHGHRILKLALEKAGEAGLDRVLVTCDADNDASRRIIESNGGDFESGMTMTPEVLRAEGRAPDVPIEKLRYWFELSSSPRRHAP